MVSIKYFSSLIVVLFLTACGGGGSSSTSSDSTMITPTTETSSKHKVNTSNLSAKLLLVGDGVEYYSISSDGSFHPNDTQHAFTVYDAESEEPLYFSYAGKESVLIDEYSTAFYLVSKNFPAIFHADADIISQYNATVSELAEFENLAKKIKESITLYNKIDRAYIESELKQAYLVLKDAYEKGIISSDSVNLNFSPSTTKIASKETTSYPKFRGIRFEDIAYTKNNNDTYTVDLTIRNSNPAYLGMTLADVSYKDGQYRYIGRYDNEYILIEPGNTSAFYKSFSSAKGIGQFVGDIASAWQLSKEHGVITGLANSNFGESVTKVKDLTLSCDKDAVVISANDTTTLVTNAVFLTLDLVDLIGKLPNGIEKTKGFRTTAINYSSNQFKAELTKNIIANKDFIKNGIVLINNKDFSSTMAYLMSEDFLVKILFKETFNTFVKTYGMSKKDASAIIAVALGSYNVSKELSVDTLIATNASLLSGQTGLN